jgi:hypothetical protein
MEREQLGDQRNDGENNFNSGDGTGQMAQPWMFMMMMCILLVVLQEYIVIHGPMNMKFVLHRYECYWHVSVSI